MGDLAGLPEWLVVSICVIVIGVLVCTIAWRNTQRQIARTLVRRRNPTRDQFMAMMAPDVSRKASEFVWDEATLVLDFHKPSLAPHPDDHLVDDLPIDEDDWSLDWPSDWAEREGFHVSNLPDWPREWPPTLRNFARWLDMGPR